jgi:26S proteasome regulatory subunit N9
LTFADKINQLKLVELGLAASQQCKDYKDALDFLQMLVKKVDRVESRDAYVYATVEVARIKLCLEPQDLEGARNALDEAEMILDKFDSVESIVHASFYRVNSDYYSTKREFSDYYKNALLYLACVQSNELPVTKQQELAYNLSVAALLSDRIYNFGELLLHPILDSLLTTEHSWLRELLFAFNTGDLGKYNSLIGHFSKQILFQEKQQFLRQKLCLSALTEAVFRRPPHDRALSFDTITIETGVPRDEVEYLLMKALSQGLVRGTIDQISGIARISWVQPKVLDKNQIENMRQRLIEWDGNVSKLNHYMEAKLSETVGA